MSSSKRHHYIPQTYLRPFADSRENLCVYDRVSKTYRSQLVKDTGIQQHYYRYRTVTGGTDDLEGFFSKIEGDATAVIAKLIRGETFTQEDAEIVIPFLALLATRTPDFEKKTNELKEKMMKRLHKLHMPSVEDAKKLIEKYRKENGESSMTSISPETLYDFIHSEKYGYEIPREDSIHSMLDIANVFTEVFSTLDWTFLYAPSGTRFITTDNPLAINRHTYLQNFMGAGVGTPGAQKFMPLAPNLCLLMGDEGNRINAIEIGQDKVHDINMFLARHSDRFIFDREKEYLEPIIEESKVDEISTTRERVHMS